MKMLTMTDYRKYRRALMGHVVCFLREGKWQLGKVVGHIDAHFYVSVNGHNFTVPLEDVTLPPSAQKALQ
jgi:hypothetical protein